jgi:carbon storage regulator
MLYLTRRPGESIIINGEVEITVVRILGRTVRLACNVPPHATVLRRELHDRIAARQPPSPNPRRHRPA